MESLARIFAEQEFKNDFAVIDFCQCDGSRCLALNLGIDHEAPYADLRILGRRQEQRFILEHDKANRDFGKVDSAVPGFWRKQGLGQ